MESEAILVSIIINNYNYAQFLPEAIESALTQNYPHTEIIVVDDGSTDNSREIISNYEEKVIPALKENGGQASAFNAGFAASKGEIICFLDADDYYLPQKVIQVIKLFEQHPQIGWIFHDLEDVDINGSILKKQRKRRISEFNLVDLREIILKGKKLTYWFTATSGLCFKRNILEEILPMPEQFKISSDSFVRLAAVHLSPGILSPERLATHRSHGNNLYAFRKDVGIERAKLGIKAAYYLREKFPNTKKFTDNYFASSLVQLIRLTNVSQSLELFEAQNYLKSDPELIARIGLILQVAFVYMKYQARQVLNTVSRKT
ncbi:MAG: glycosyltransferase [Spirulinaceae cyanobacterium]